MCALPAQAGAQLSFPWRATPATDQNARTISQGFCAGVIAALAVIDFRADAAPVVDPEADEEAELRREFDAMDLDRNGLLNRSELS
ncbi:hypothetical protein T492DRAFT_854132 [Pavlovales sp. CCMP2436]|nr:hypothetical protein T492DRAFT_854132 [Pavlovales sp. CCMP2436]